MLKHIANMVTGLRIFCAITLLFFPPRSPLFWALYLLCGFSDMIDGTIARKTDSAGEFGAKFDTCADFAFTATSFVKLLPEILLPEWLWIWIAAIGIIKIGNIAARFIRRKKLLCPHTKLNKITGLFLFLLPLTLDLVEVKYSAAAVCLLATIAAIQEGYCTQTKGNTAASR